MADHIRGNPDAPVVLVEYADFECPYCAMAYPIVKRLSQRFHDDLAEVFRPFPLVEIHPHAMHAAQAAEAAAEQGKFWEMHDTLFEHHTNLDDASLITYAHRLGLDLAQFQKDFESPAIVERIARNIRLGVQEGVKGTPTFFLNGVQLQLLSFADLEPLIRRALAEVGSSRQPH
ncbi:MAG: DsbA family protein [Vulcanimicrobiaceae bacterium]